MKDEIVGNPNHLCCADDCCTREEREANRKAREELESKKEAAPKRPFPTFDLQLSPDWIKSYTVEKAESELNNFKFKGPGWYLDDTGGALLVLESEFTIFDGMPREKKWRFHYWYASPLENFKQLVNGGIPTYQV